MPPTLPSKFVADRPSIGIAVAILAIALLAPACNTRRAVEPAVTFEPTTIAVIESTVPVGNDKLEFTLVGGGTFTYPRATALDDVEPVAQDLLLAGEQDGAPWAVVVSSNRAGGSCFRVRAPAFAKERRVVFESGMSLAMAPGFDPASAGADGKWENDQAGFCVDATGQVTSYH